MRDKPRTCPSIRCSLFSTDALASLCMRSIYPLGVYYARRNAMTHADHDHHGHDHGHSHAQGVLDPVCGMTVDPHTAKHRHDYKGHTYYFCSAGCRAKFATDPEKY